MGLAVKVVQQAVEISGTRKEIVVVLVVALIVAVLAEHHCGMVTELAAAVDLTQVGAVLLAVST